MDFLQQLLGGMSETEAAELGQAMAGQAMSMPQSMPVDLTPQIAPQEPRQEAPMYIPPPGMPYQPPPVPEQEAQAAFAALPPEVQSALESGEAEEDYSVAEEQYQAQMMGEEAAYAAMDTARQEGAYEQAIGEARGNQQALLNEVIASQQAQKEVQEEMAARMEQAYLGIDKALSIEVSDKGMWDNASIMDIATLLSKMAVGIYKGDPTQVIGAFTDLAAKEIEKQKTKKDSAYKKYMTRLDALEKTSGIKLDAEGRNQAFLVKLMDRAYDEVEGMERVAKNEQEKMKLKLLGNQIQESNANIRSKLAEAQVTESILGRADQKLAGSMATKSEPTDPFRGAGEDLQRVAEVYSTSKEPGKRAEGKRLNKVLSQGIYVDRLMDETAQAFDKQIDVQGNGLVRLRDAVSNKVLGEFNPQTDLENLIATLLRNSGALGREVSIPDLMLVVKPLVGNIDWRTGPQALKEFKRIALQGILQNAVGPVNKMTEFGEEINKPNGKADLRYFHNKIRKLTPEAKFSRMGEKKVPAFSKGALQ